MLRKRERKEEGVYIHSFIHTYIQPVLSLLILSLDISYIITFKNISSPMNENEM